MIHPQIDRLPRNERDLLIDSNLYYHSKLMDLQGPHSDPAFSSRDENLVSLSDGFENFSPRATCCFAFLVFENDYLRFSCEILASGVFGMSFGE